MFIKGTFLSIDIKALLHNFIFFRSKIKRKTKIVGVVKAFSYGHEASVIAKALEKNKVDYFGVAYVQEGVSLRKAGITTPILVFHPQAHDIEQCIDYQLEPSIYSFRILAIFLKLMSVRDLKDYKIHLKFNTGMNRLGFEIKDSKKIIEIITQDNYLKVASIFSHLVASEDLKESKFTNTQVKKYKQITAFFEDNLPYSFIKHIANSTGVLNYPDFHFDMVRIGIGLYGYANDIKWTAKLKNVAKLYSIISQIHTLEKGESVGYNRAFIANKMTRVATVPIGYADGIPRRWSKGVGFFTINGKKAIILGNVCMDMIMIDITDIDCKEGDQVSVFDNQNTLEELATRTGTISYELLTDISIRVPRIVINNK